MSSLARNEGNFLEAELPIRAIGTLTYPYRCNHASLVYQFGKWVAGLQSYHKVTIGWIRAVERDPAPHLHCALVAHASLDCEFAEHLWRKINAIRQDDSAKVETYVPHTGGLPYVLKSISEPWECVEFSPNLVYFSSNAFPKHSARTAEQRRQLRRIRKQRLALDAPSAGSLPEDIGRRVKVIKRFIFFAE